MRRGAVFVIYIYQKIFSPDQGVLRYLYNTNTETCVFYPSCSEYTKQAIHKYGIKKGVWLGVKRIRRCSPFTTPQLDHIP